MLLKYAPECQNLYQSKEKLTSHSKKKGGGREKKGSSHPEGQKCYQISNPPGIQCPPDIVRGGPRPPRPTSAPRLSAERLQTCLVSAGSELGMPTMEEEEEEQSSPSIPSCARLQNGSVERRRKRRSLRRTYSTLFLSPVRRGLSKDGRSRGRRGAGNFWRRKEWARVFPRREGGNKIGFAVRTARKIIFFWPIWCGKWGWGVAHFWDKLGYVKKNIIKSSLGPRSLPKKRQREKRKGRWF